DGGVVGERRRPARGNLGRQRRREITYLPEQNLITEDRPYRQSGPLQIRRCWKLAGLYMSGRPPAKPWMKRPSTSQALSSTPASFTTVSSIVICVPAAGLLGSKTVMPKLEPPSTSEKSVAITARSVAPTPTKPHGVALGQPLTSQITRS